MNDLEHHQHRVETDTAYSEGFGHGQIGGTTDANPWRLGQTERTSWDEGWRVGHAFRQMDSAANSEGVLKEIREALHDPTTVLE